MPHDRLATKGLRFKMRTVFVWMAFVALVIGWYASMERERTRTARLVQQLMNAQSQVRMAESRAQIQADAHSAGNQNAKGVLSKAKFEGVNLRDAVIQA